MRSLFFTCLSVLMWQLSLAQINMSVKAIPTNPSNTDEVVIVGEVSLMDGCLKFDSTTTIIGNEILIEACYGYGWGMGGTTFSDTAYYNIGPLSEGVYNVRYIIHASPSFTDSLCSNYNKVDSSLVTFTVGSTSISSFIKEILMFSSNPTANQLTIQANTITGNYQITNTTGQLLLQNTITQPNFNIDVSTLPPGLYFLQLSNGRQRVVKKFVKQ